MCIFDTWLPCRINLLSQRSHNMPQRDTDALIDAAASSAVDGVVDGLIGAVTEAAGS